MGFESFLGKVGRKLQDKIQDKLNTDEVCAAPSQPINAVYYPSWRVYKDKPPSCLDVRSITHIFYAFVGVNEDGTLRALDEWADKDKETDGEKGCLAAIAKLKRENPHIKTLVSIGGGASSNEFPALARSETARKTFAQQIKVFCDTHHLDGVDIDWEHPKTTEAGKDYIRYLQAIREAMPAPNYLLTTALPTGVYVLKHINLSAAGRLLDFLNLMAYDFTGSWTNVCGHHAQLQRPSDSSVDPALRVCCEGGIDYLLRQGFPRHKIVLGIPAYARYFSKARAEGHAFDGAGEMEYCDLPNEWVGRANVDRERAAASFIDPSGEKGFVSFDVPSTVRMKARYAKEVGLGGLFYWHGAGDRTGGESLVAAGWQELHSR